MKHKIFSASIVFGIILFGDLFANESAQESSKKQSISLKTRDEIDVGLQNYWYKYAEEVDGAFFMSNTGYKYGLSATGIKTIGDEYYMSADARYATGDVKYKSASGTGNVADKMYEIRVLAGKEAIIENYLLSSYIGVGYRRLDNDLRDLGSGGYRRTSQYLYIPIGVTHRFALDDISRISSSIEYDYFAWGEQKSYLSDISAAYAAVYGDPINKQKHGYGARINTAYEQENWSIGLFFNYWKIGDSQINYYVVFPTVYSAMEPKNETKEVGVQIKYRF
ncbi:MAG: hypothetical protein PHQ22_01815 [Sulfuricurvum sp.]|nr:hypothetical protein [Sulfuricurvum sp.]